MWKRMNCICRAAFTRIATRTKVRAKLWLLTNTPWSWIPDSRARGPELRGTHTWIAGFATEGGQKTFDAHLASARDAITRALAIEPGLPDALYARAWIETNFDLIGARRLRPWQSDGIGAGRSKRANCRRQPRDGTRKYGSSIEIYRKAVELDPVNAQSRSFLAFGLANRKRFAEARAEYARVIELNSSAPWAHAGLG